MSINYYGVATADRARIGSLVEGTPDPDVPPIDIAAMYQALTRRWLKGPENGTLRWEDSAGGYVFVDLSPTCVLVTQGTGGSEDGIDVIIDVVSAINAAGLNVWDPQQGTWFPGSPVTATKSRATKPKAKAKAKAKAKPKAKAKAKPKTKAKAKAKAKPKAAAKTKTKKTASRRKR